jgi:ATP/maltotriose-dependent transcriptional regulator MalT
VVRALGSAGDDAPADLRAKALGGAGWLALFQGDYPSAESLVAQSLALWRGLGDAFRIVNGLMRLGAIFHWQGRFAEAVATIEEELTLLEELGDASGAAALQATWALSGLGGIEYERGEFARAGEYLATALVRQREMGFDLAASSTLFDLGRLASSLGDLAEAAARFRDSLEIARSPLDPWVAARALARMADLALAWGQPERASRFLGTVAALDEFMGGSAYPSERRIQEQTREAARAALGEAAFAAAWAAGRSMPPEETIAEAMTIAPPLPSPNETAPETAAPFQLTPREVEVLRLVAAGLSDADVAARLFVSVHTVKTHLRAIYGKLDVPSRTAAARVAVEHGLA